MQHGRYAGWTMAAVVTAAALTSTRASAQGVPWDTFDDPSSPSRCDVVNAENAELVVLADTGELRIVSGNDVTIPGSIVEADSDVYIDGIYSGFIAFDFDGEDFRTLWWFDPTGVFVSNVDRFTLEGLDGDLRPIDFVDVACNGCPLWDDPLVACGAIEFEILAHPQDRVACEGDDVVLSVVTYSSVIPDFQWFVDGDPIPGADGEVLVLANVTPFAEGMYDVQIDVDGVMFISDAALVIVEDCTPTLIVGHPADETVCAGDDAAFSVDAVGTKVAGFQWYHNGRALAGSDGDTIVIPDTIFADDGFYEVDVLLDNGGVLTSDLAELVVLDCVDTEIVRHPQDDVLCEGEDITLSVEVVGDDIVAFEWFVDGDPIPGSDGDVLIIENADRTDSGAYEVDVILDSGARLSSDPATIIVESCDEPVEILAEPRDRTTCEGDTATFSVQVTGEVAAFEWFVDGVAIPGSDGATISLPDVGVSDEAVYSVDIITPSGVRIDGGSARLRVDDCRGGGGVVICGGNTAAGLCMTIAGLCGLGLRRRQ